MTPTEMPLSGHYDLRLVVLSVAIAVFASGAALDLAGRVTAWHGRARARWLASGALAMGLGIWSMHYTGMLAFKLPVPVQYELSTVALSLVAAILASAVALYVASRAQLTTWRLTVGSLAMGGGIAAMHYTGMFAMRLPAAMTWNLWLVLASVAIAIAVSAVALWLAFRHGHTGTGEWTWGKAGSALLMGLAIPAMHYTGMAAAHFMAAEGPVAAAGTVSISTLGEAAIAAGTLLVLGAAILTSIVDRQIMTKTLALQAALAEVKTLRGLLPICANCKSIRTDQGSWQQIESYVRQHTEAEFSHGMCPQCAAAWEASIPA